MIASGRPLDQRALAEILRAHRDDDVHRHRFVGSGFDEQGDEGLGVLAAGIVLVPEELLELVGDEDEVPALRQVPVLAPLDERFRAAAEERGEDLDLVLLRRRTVAEAEERLGERADRVAARAEVGDLPVRAGAGEIAELQRVEQAGLDEGGLAAAGGAEDGEEAGRGEDVDHLVDAGLAAEEDVELFPLEGAQSRIGDPPPGRRVHQTMPVSSWSTRSGVSPARQSTSSTSGRATPTEGFSSGGA